MSETPAAAPAASLASLAGLAAPAAVGACALIAAAAYRGTEGQAYSPLTHWVSELGDETVSQLAEVFNAGAVVGGTCFAAFVAALASGRAGRLARFYGPLGVAAGLAGALVGLFPMNRVVPHAIAASSFFSLTELTIALASVDFARRPDGPFGRAQAAIGAASTATFLAFAIATVDAVRTRGLAALEPPVSRDVPSPLTTLEWASLLWIMAWVGGAAVGAVRAPR